MMEARIPKAIELKDLDGDHLRVSRRTGSDVIHFSVGHGASSCHVHLAAEQVRGLLEYLTALTADGGPAAPVGESSTPVEVEAGELVRGGDREDQYGHPRESFTRIAVMWTALLSPKLDEGECVTAEDVGRLMVALKLSRDVSGPKRDNRVDGIGYLIALDRLASG